MGIYFRALNPQKELDLGAVSKQIYVHYLRQKPFRGPLSDFQTHRYRHVFHLLRRGLYHGMPALFKRRPNEACWWKIRGVPGNPILQPAALRNWLEICSKGNVKNSSPSVPRNMAIFSFADLESRNALCGISIDLQSGPCAC